MKKRVKKPSKEGKTEWPIRGFLGYKSKPIKPK